MPTMWQEHQETKKTNTPHGVQLAAPGIVPAVTYHKLCTVCHEAFDATMFEKRYVLIVDGGVKTSLCITLAQLKLPSVVDLREET